MSPLNQHTPVLLEEIINMVEARPGLPRWGLDLTFGRGGHARALLQHFPSLKMLALDRDGAAVDYGKEAFQEYISNRRLKVLHKNFHEFVHFQNELLQMSSPEGFDFILADLGVSSPQLDEPERGFSFYHQGPLDMRMDQTQELTAAHVVNDYSEEELCELFLNLGEVRRPQRVVKAIIKDRKERPFTRTEQLSSLIERIEGWQRRGHHPATKYFLALRMHVNRELDGLEPIITPLIESLASHGRLMFITFHSLEDRIIKYALRERLALGALVNKKVIVPSREECKNNPRARSAKLRVFARDRGQGV